MLFDPQPATPPAAPAPEAGVSAFRFLHFAERQRIDTHLSTGQGLGLLLFEIDNFRMFRDVYGPQVAGKVEEVLARELEGAARERLSCCPLLYLEPAGPGRRMVLCGGGEEAETALPDLALALRLRLRAAVRGEALNLTGQSLDLLAGYAPLHAGIGQSLEHMVYAAMGDARRMASGALDAAKLALLREFRGVVAGGQLSVVFQPIVSLSSGQILAWEALTRGPRNSNFHSPAVLFDFAEEAGEVFALERVCRENALHDVGRLDQEQKLFLNVNPHAVVDPSFSPGQTRGLLDRFGLRPSDVVLEITERHSIRDFALFHKTLEHYRNQGFLIAVDDVGSGYSGLWTIAELRPDYLKVDQSLVRDLDRHQVKRALMETFVALAEKIGSRIIAEGVETESELTTLMRLGVHYGQGYFIRRPAFPKPGLSDEVRGHFVGASRIVARGDRRFSAPVRDLAGPAPQVPPTASVAEVRQLLGEGGPSASVAVVEEGRPLGLVMGHHLDRALSSPYGVALYLKRPAALVMDPAPLIVDGATPVENVAREAMGRGKSKVFDHILVTEQGRLVGAVTVQHMLDTLAAAQVEMAKGASPLTGLPGNVAIETELERRCREGRAFCVVYADLDNFKAYNDTYGFKKGDEVILLLAKAMAFALRRHGASPLDFLGHVGGDDFLGLCEPERAERICRSVARVFGRLIRGFYTPQDAQHGWIQATDREGVERRIPLVSVSLAMVDCQGSCDLPALSRRAADMKKYAKSIPGNSWVRDRRGPGGGAETESCICPRP